MITEVLRHVSRKLIADSGATRPSELLYLFTTAGAKRTLDLCGAMLDHTNSPNRKKKGDNIFAFLWTFPGIIGRKQLRQPFCIMVWLCSYILNRIRLDLHLDNFCCIQPCYIQHFSHTKNSLM